VDKFNVSLHDRLFNDPLTVLVADFLTEIGIGIESAQIQQETFLPGILV
jgi:hypothetical protein